MVSFVSLILSGEALPPFDGREGNELHPCTGISNSSVSLLDKLLALPASHFLFVFSHHGLLLDMRNNFVGCQIVYLHTKHLFFEQTSCHNSEVQGEEGLGRSKTIFQARRTDQEPLCSELHLIQQSPQN